MNKLNHIAVITDGNGRWATMRGLPRSKGHDEGKKTFWNICQWALERGIPYVSFYVLSLDNLNRDKDEIDHVFEIGREIYSGGGVEKCKANGIRLIYAGDRERITQEDAECMAKGEAATKDCDKLICLLYTCYGGRDEIVRAANQCVADGVELTEEAISARLYGATVNAPDPDLILRTGGFSRLSGFLPWESIYSELYITPTLYPDLTREEFNWACRWFESVERTHGGDREPKATEQTATTRRVQAVSGASPFAKKEAANGAEKA